MKILFKKLVTTGLFNTIVFSVAWLTINSSVLASSAICTPIENDPATKYLLNAPPDTIEGADSFVYKAVNVIDLRLHVFKADKIATNENLAISSKPNLLALFYPCSDVTTDDKKLYGGDAIGNHGKEASPLYHIRKNLPPTLIIQGTDDIVYSESKKFCLNSKSLGNSCELIVYQNASHGFFAQNVENAKRYNKTLQEWIDS